VQHSVRVADHANPGPGRAQPGIQLVDLFWFQINQANRTQMGHQVAADNLLVLMGGFGPQGSGGCLHPGLQVLLEGHLAAVKRHAALLSGKHLPDPSLAFQPRPKGAREVPAIERHHGPVLAAVGGDDRAFIIASSGHHNLLLSL